MPEAHYLPPVPQEAPASTIGALFARKKTERTAVDEAEALRMTGGQSTARPRIRQAAEPDDEDARVELVEGETTLAGLSRMLGRPVQGAKPVFVHPAALAAAALRKTQG